MLLTSQLPPVRTAALTAALLPELIELPVRPLSWSTDDPSRVTVAYGRVDDRLDVYFPAGASPERPRPAVVLALGVHTVPLDHPDIVRIASAIARAGVVAAVPDSTALRNLDVGPGEPAHLVDAVLMTASQPGVRSDRVGIAGFSAGASIALIAAADARLSGTVSFVSAFGGYASAERLLVDVATRTTVRDGQVEAWQPDPGIRGDILSLLLARLDESEARRLRPLLEPVVLAPEPPHGGDPSVASALSGDARAGYMLFTAGSRVDAEAALAGGSERLTSDLAAISPVTFADAIAVPVFLLHGQPDTAIPVEHASLLEQAIGDEVVRVTRFGGFGHEQPGRSGLGIEDAGDVWELGLYLRDIVAAATE